MMKFGTLNSYRKKPVKKYLNTECILLLILIFAYLTANVLKSNQKKSVHMKFYFSVHVQGKLSNDSSRENRSLKNELGLPMSAVRLTFPLSTKHIKVMDLVNKTSFRSRNYTRSLSPATKPPDYRTSNWVQHTKNNHGSYGSHGKENYLAPYSRLSSNKDLYHGRNSNGERGTRFNYNHQLDNNLISDQTRDNSHTQQLYHSLINISNEKQNRSRRHGNSLSWLLYGGQNLENSGHQTLNQINKKNPSHRIGKKQKQQQRVNARHRYKRNTNELIQELYDAILDSIHIADLFLEISRAFVRLLRF